MASANNPEGPFSFNCERFSPMLVRWPPCTRLALFDLSNQYLFSQVHALQLNYTSMIIALSPLQPFTMDPSDNLSEEGFELVNVY